MSSVCFLDPGVIVWDRDHFSANANQYWDIPEYFALFLDLLEDTGDSVLISGAMHDCLIESFPADQIASRSSDLRDFVHIVYAFIANTLPHCASFHHAGAGEITPDVPGRAHFPAQLVEESRGGLSKLISEQDSYVVSNFAVWPWAGKKVTVQDVHEVSELPTLLTRADIVLRKRLSTRVYEANPKHHMFAEAGTPLPRGMSDAYLQLLLDNAIWSRRGRRLCAYAADFETHIVFHRHDANKFHGFPESAESLTLKGFAVEEIPRLSWNPEER